jgi:hypothetical protein
MEYWTEILKRSLKNRKDTRNFSRDEELALKGLHHGAAKNKNGTNAKPSCQSPKEPWILVLKKPKKYRQRGTYLG